MTSHLTILSFLVPKHRLRSSIPPTTQPKSTPNNELELTQLVLPGLVGDLEDVEGHAVHGGLAQRVEPRDVRTAVVDALQDLGQLGVVVVLELHRGGGRGGQEGHSGHGGQGRGQGAAGRGRPHGPGGTRGRQFLGGRRGGCGERSERGRS